MLLEVEAWNVFLRFGGVDYQSITVGSILRDIIVLFPANHLLEVYVREFILWEPRVQDQDVSTIWLV